MAPLTEPGTLRTAVDVAGGVTVESQLRAADPPAAVAEPPSSPDLLARIALPELSRRRFLRGATFAGGGLVGVGVVACAANVVPSLTPSGASPTPRGPRAG